MLAQVVSNRVPSRIGPRRVFLSDVQFRMIPASDSKNLLPCCGGKIYDTRATENKLLCRILSESDVRCPIERHDRENRVSYSLRPVSAASVSSANTSVVAPDDDIQYHTCDVLMAGWCVKWPMKSQLAGTSTKRFFVLLAAHSKSSVVSAVLAYWVRPPNCLSSINYNENRPAINNGEMSHEEIDLSTSKGRIYLDAASSVALQESLLSSSYIEITTPVDSLYLECSSKDLELSWFSKLSAVISYQRLVVDLKFPNRKLFVMRNSGLPSHSHFSNVISPDNPNIDNEYPYCMRHEDVESAFTSHVLSPSFCRSDMTCKDTLLESTSEECSLVNGTKSVTVLEVSVSEAITSTASSAASGRGNEVEKELTKCTFSRSTRYQEQDYSTIISSLSSTAETSVEDPLTIAASPSNSYSKSDILPTVSVGQSVEEVARTSTRDEACTANVPSVSVDSGVDLDENIRLSSSGMREKKLEGGSEDGLLNHRRSIGLAGTKATLSLSDGITAVLTFECKLSVKGNGASNSGSSSGEEADRGFHYIHLMGGSNLSYRISIDSGTFKEV